MPHTPFIRRVILRNYRSIGYCNVQLRPLTYLVGHNGAGKSNFMDALHFVKDALSNSLEYAFNERAGISEVRRYSNGRPNNFSIRIDFNLPDGQPGHYAFAIGALVNGGYEVQREECVVAGIGKGPYFRVAKGKLRESSEVTFPAVVSDRLALIAASGMPAFRPVFDALKVMGFYNLNPKLMRELQKPQDGRLLQPAGENIASVIGHLERAAPHQLKLIQEYLRSVSPMVHSVARKSISHMETLEFRQDTAGSTHPWRFQAQNMSDGTLRALGVLTALFQSNEDYSPTLIGIEEPETALHPAASAALREALVRASETTQVLVTSHSPDLLDDRKIDADAVLAVVSEAGETKIAPLDEGSRQVMRNHLFSVGELLRMNQLEPDRVSIEQQDNAASGDLFSETESA
ncbi:MAG: AAA family ATPase [Alcaligenaceae bacterium]|nr:AAA family ATPase [Alcaligenaceae bacterium]